MRDHPRRRRSVALYVVLALLVCAAGTAVQIGLTTKQTYDRERARASVALQSVTAAEASDLEQALEAIPPLVEGLAHNADVASFAADRCRRAFASLDGGISGARITALDPSGHQVCSTGDDPARSARQQPTGPWFTQAVHSPRPVWVPPAQDALGAGPVVLVADRIPTRHGTGVVVAVLYDRDWVTVPPGQPSDTAVFVLDAQRQNVFSTTTGAAVHAGDQVVNDRYGHLVPGGRVGSVLESNGTWLYALSTIPTLGLTVVGGRLQARALASAQAVFKESLIVGAAALAVLMLLGLVFYRILARPLRGLAQVVAASGDDDDVRAQPTGPAEVVALAERFNELLDERIAREANLRWRATHDPLTGLPNRPAIASLLSAMTDEAPGADAALLFLDLDRFKLVNDSHGHAVGDEILRAVAARLADALPAGHQLCRFGGDEFVVLCPATSLADAEQLARMLITVVCQPVTVDEQDLYVGACVGIAAASAGTPAHDVIRDADTAMYRAKSTGSGSTAVFDEQMHAWAVSRLGLESDLRGAMDRGELAVHYQPIVDLGSGQVAALEALLRWTHPVRGNVPPCDFIPVAEQTGLIIPIGRWVLEMALRQAQLWTRASGRPIRACVNVSAVQIAGGELTNAVREALSMTGVPADLLELEVTEGSILEDVELAERTLTELRALGVTIALDDFGTGYSSLAHLRRLPLDVVKIDRSFVMDVDVDPRSSQIVRAVVALSNALNLQIVAEGVENEQQLGSLQRFGCQAAQGFLLSKPRPPEVLDDLIRTGVRLPQSAGRTAAAEHLVTQRRPSRSEVPAG